MQDYMTKIEGVPSKDDIRPGMAFFAKTGPEGSTCGKCKMRGYYRQSSRLSVHKKTGEAYYKTYRVAGKCSMFKKMTGKHGSDVAVDYPGCKYFEPKPKDPS